MKQIRTDLPSATVTRLAAVGFPPILLVAAIGVACTTTALGPVRTITIGQERLEDVVATGISRFEVEAEGLILTYTGLPNAPSCALPSKVEIRESGEEVLVKLFVGDRPGTDCSVFGPGESRTVTVGDLQGDDRPLVDGYARW